MKPFAKSEIRRYHCQQSRHDSCLAACCAMVECHRRGYSQADLPALEEALIGNLDSGQWGLDPVLAGLELGYQWQPAEPTDSFRSYDKLRGLLQDRWLIITVHAGPWVVHLNQLRPPPISDYGPLVKPSYEGEDLTQRGLPHHTLVLTAAVGPHFLALDPYHRADAQPFQVSDSSLAADIWTGQLLVPPAP